MHSSFLSTCHYNLFPHEHLSITVACCFYLAHYQDQLFQTYGVCFDDSLSKAVAKRKAEFLAGRVCAQEALSRIGLPNSHVPIGAARSPIFPASYLGSISHTNDCAICVIAPRSKYVALGIDVELWMTMASAQELKSQILNETEIALCTQLELNFAQALTLCFSAKESFFKAYYDHVGRYFGFEAARVVEIKIHGDGGILYLKPDLEIVGYLPKLVEFEIGFRLEADRVITHHLLPKTALIE
jgi:enterobactin synthetase component D